jgi:tetratricopeptide (TPR) repeat protein
MIHFKQSYTTLEDDPFDKDVKLECELLYYLTDTSVALTDVFQASNYVSKCLEFFKEEENQSQISNSLFSKIKYVIGLTSLSKEQYSQSLDSLSDSLQYSLKESRASADLNLLGKLTFNIGKALKHLGIEDLSVQYLRKSVDVTIKSKDVDTNSLATSLLNSLPKPTTTTSLPEAPKVTPALPLYSLLQITLASETSDEDFEDWDAELDLDTTERQTLSLAANAVPTTTPSPAPTQTLMGASGKLPVAEQKKEIKMEYIPAKYILIDSNKKNDVEIIKYPKSTWFYSIKSVEGHSLLNEETLQKVKSCRICGNALLVVVYTCVETWIIVEK